MKVGIALKIMVPRGGKPLSGNINELVDDLSRPVRIERKGLFSLRVPPDDPPDPEMQSPAKAATEARANCKAEQKHLDLSDDLTDRQASRIERLFQTSYALAAAIAPLAYGVAR